MSESRQLKSTTNSTKTKSKKRCFIKLKPVNISKTQQTDETDITHTKTIDKKRINNDIDIVSIDNSDTDTETDKIDKIDKETLSKINKIKAGPEWRATDYNFARIVKIADIPVKYQNHESLYKIFCKFGTIKTISVNQNPSDMNNNNHNSHNSSNNTSSNNSNNSNNTHHTSLRNIGRAMIEYTDASSAQYCANIMNETELLDRTLQVFIGMPPSVFQKLHEKRIQNRTERKRMRELQKEQRKLMRQKQAQLQRRYGGPYGIYRGMRGRLSRGIRGTRGRGRGRGYRGVGIHPYVPGPPPRGVAAAAMHSMHSMHHHYGAVPPHPPPPGAHLMGGAGVPGYMQYGEYGGDYGDYGEYGEYEGYGGNEYGTYDEQGYDGGMGGMNGMNYHAVRGSDRYRGR